MISENTILRILLLFASAISLESEAQQPDSTTTDSTLLRQFEQQMQTSSPTAAAQPRSSLSFNPDIGLIGDFRGSYISSGKKNVDAWLNETEISLQSVVDPYVRADFFLSLGRNPVTNAYGISVEEGYLTSLSLPGRLQLKAGKFKEALGKINTTHAHALPFIDMPNAFVNFFGEEGLNDEGASLSWLLPTQKVYQELTFQVTTGFTDGPVFARSAGNRLIYLGHLKNFFTLSDNATFELGLTGISGSNRSATVTNMAAADLTYKWKPVRLNNYHSITWQSEFFYGHSKNADSLATNSFGLFSYLEYQIARRWFLTGRYDYAQKPYNRMITEQAYSLTAGWYATEFQKIELEGKTADESDRSRYYQVWLRWIFIIGAHGAHQY
jgi:hypothetical protein